jgi:hypothetical protein
MYFKVDLQYIDLEREKYIARLPCQGVSLIVRYNLHSLNLYDAEGQKIEVEAVLRTTSAMELCQPVQVRGTILGKYSWKDDAKLVRDISRGLTLDRRCRYDFQDRSNQG